MSEDKEKEIKKYIDAVELLIRLEKQYSMSAEEIEAMEPRDLYDYLQNEWWREWNGLTQEWINPE